MSVADDIKLAVERAAGQSATHLEAVPIMETFKGQTVWEGIVEVYSLAKPPPDRGYGWAVKDPAGTQYVAVLSTPPIDSPLAAVRAWIAAKARPMITKEDLSRFILQVSEESYSEEDWRRIAVNHYDDEDMEDARRKLVRYKLGYPPPKEEAHLSLKELLVAISAKLK